MYNQIINLDLIPQGVRPVIYVSQYDNQTSALTFRLYKGGTAFSVPDGAAVLINGMKPDNTGFSYAAASVSGQNVTCNVMQQMTAVAGDVDCELRIRSDTEIIGTLNFILRVEPAALSDDSVISETMIPLIEQAVDIAANLAEYIDDAVEAAETATDAAQSASDTADDIATVYSNVTQMKDQITQAVKDANEAAEAANDAADEISGITATATTLAAGSSATASYSNGVLSLGIPTGATGAAGASGVITEISGFFTMWVDASGNLYCSSATDMSYYWYYDTDTGNLYFLTETEEE